MNKIFRSRLLGHDIYVRIGKRVDVLGVNSTLPFGRSVLFWEFDGITRGEVVEIMEGMVDMYDLPEVHVLQASTDRSWHAVCMASYPWLQALSIVAASPRIDPDYVRLAAHRERFTLRLTDKGQGAPRLRLVVPGVRTPDCEVGDLVSGVRYGAWTREGAHDA